MVCEKTYTVAEKENGESFCDLNVIIAVGNLNRAEVWRTTYKDIMSVGLIRFKCDICNEQVKRDRNMKSHKDVKTGGEVFEETLY